ncbi:DUF4350 domain-containing protein [Saccharicrinis sp. FJH54]|uniref:DUF4350 domain-containing protein n=1 Tax=Saccharicrinis sp. FJH54 TaxID=3344665 RepID=UPI0035D496CD
MRKSNLKYLLLSAGLFILLILLQHYAPKPEDWRMSFDRNHKAPYGCYVLNQQVYPELFPEPVTYNLEPFADNPLLDTIQKTKRNLIMITGSFKPEEEDVKTLLDFVKAGNSAFLSFNSYAFQLLKELKLSYSKGLIDTAYLKTAKDTLNFYNPALKKDSGYVFNNRLMTNYLLFRDSCKAYILGYDRRSHVNFVRFNLGKGELYIHTQPLVFTNINLLYSDPDYVAAALSYLPDQPLIVDRFYKPFKIENEVQTSFLLSHNPLRFAFYIILFVLVVYLVFGSRRKQRIIPVIEPLKNTSLDFIKTVGRLYYKSENHATIAHKLSTYFKEFLREKYYINDVSESEENVNLISGKTGVNRMLVKKVLHKVNYFQDQPNVTGAGLMAYNKDIEEFYKTCL